MQANCQISMHGRIDAYCIVLRPKRPWTAACSFKQYYSHSVRILRRPVYSSICTHFLYQADRVKAMSPPHTCSYSYKQWMDGWMDVFGTYPHAMTRTPHVRKNTHRDTDRRPVLRGLRRAHRRAAAIVRSAPGPMLTSIFKPRSHDDRTYLNFLFSNMLLLLVSQVHEKTEVHHKVLRRHVAHLALQPLKVSVVLLIRLRVDVLVQRRLVQVERFPARVCLGVQSVHQEPCFREVSRVAVQAVRREPTCKIVDD